MVAVISGNGLGLDNTSVKQLAPVQGDQVARGQEQDAQATLGQAGVNQYVNIANGNLVLQSRDESLIFGGLPLDVLRTYNSQGQLTGNQGWLFGTTRSVGGLTGTLNTAKSTITRINDDGSSTVYAYDTTTGVYLSNGTYADPNFGGSSVASGQAGALDSLSWNAGSSTWTWTDKANHQQEIYTAAGQLTTLTDSATGASYSFSYTNGVLSGIQAADGDALIFSYDANGRLTGLSIQEPASGQGSPVVRQQVAYGYDGQGRLSSVSTSLASDSNTSSASYVTSYTYDGTSDRITLITQSDGTTASYGYTQNAQGVYQVTSVTTGSGAAASTLTLSYQSGNQVVVADLQGNQWTYWTEPGGKLYGLEGPAVAGQNPGEYYSFDNNGNVTSQVSRVSQATNFQYDANGNLLTAEDPDGNVVSYTYDANDQVVSKTTYTVAAQGHLGQSNYVAPSGARTSYYVYTANGQLAYVVDPLGNVTANTYTTTATGVRVLSSTMAYRGVSYTPSTPPPALADLQAWVASAPVQAALSQGARIDYAYDARGQVSTETQWATLDANGNGVLDAGTAITTMTYSAQGQLLQKSIERGAGRATLETSSYAYDGLGRLISNIDPLGHITSYVYNDSVQSVAMIQSGGLTTTQVWNSAGKIVSSTQSATGQVSRVTSYLYNSLGQRVATVDPAGNVSYTFYDAAGRVSATVDAAGMVTAYVYDGNGYSYTVDEYATSISTSAWYSNGALTSSYPATLSLPAATANDRLVVNPSDAAGRKMELQIGNPSNGNTTYAYDGAGNQISLARWSVNSNQTFTAYTIFDADDRPAATIDAAGYVISTIYDNLGHAVQVTAYATALTAAQLTALGSKPTLSTLQPYLTTTAQDQITHNYYDAAGRLAAQIDADGYLTVTSYDETNHSETATRYAQALSATQLGTLTNYQSVASLVGLLGANPSFQQHVSFFDADGQLIKETAADGTVTTYAYDAAGRLLTKTETPAAGQGAATSVGTTYDAFGNVLTSADATGATTTNVYDALGQKIRQTDALGNTTYFYYAAPGRIAYKIEGQPNGTVPNVVGNVTAYTYNALGQVASMRNYASQLVLAIPGGGSSALDPKTATFGQVAAAVAALPAWSADADAITTYAYNMAGQLVSETDGRGYQTQYMYDGFGNLVRTNKQLSGPGTPLALSNESITDYLFDARGEIINKSVGDYKPGGEFTLYGYDAFGRVISKTPGNGDGGNLVNYTYDNLGRQIGRSQTLAWNDVRASHATYDAFGNVITQTDALGNVTRYQYDVATHTATVTVPGGVSMTTVKDAYGHTVSVTDGAGNTTTYTYDADGRLLTTKDAQGNTQSNQYDAVGHLIQTTDASGHIVAYTYDAGGRVLTRTVDPSGLRLVTSYIYDGEGRKLSINDPSGSITTFVYDATGNVVSQVQNVGYTNLTTVYTYDGAGKELTVTVGSGTAAARTTQYVYDGVGRVSQVIVDPGAGKLNLTTSYAYDYRDNLTSVTDADGNVTRYVYNYANQKVFTVDPSGAVTQTWYDLDGHVTTTRGYATLLTASQMSSLGNSPTQYDMSGLVQTLASSTDSYSQNIYNAAGQVAYTLSGAGLGVTQYVYDNAGRVTQTRTYATALSTASADPKAKPADISPYLTASSNDTISWTVYDTDGRPLYQIDGDGGVTQTTYDAAGRIASTRTYATALTGAQLNALGGSPTAAQVAALVSPSANDRVAEQVFDNAGRQIYAIDGSGAVQQTWYDADGRVTAVCAYATRLTQAQLSALGAAPTASQVAAVVSTSSDDRTSYRIYDGAGELRYAIDALGFVTETRYDTTGLVSEVLAYPGAVSTAGQVSLLQRGKAFYWVGTMVGGATGANADSNAEATLYLYDAAGRQRYALRQTQGGTSGVVSERRYDSNGNVVAEVRYGSTVSLTAGTALTAQWNIGSLSTALAGIAAANQQVTNYVYDADNRAIYRIDPLGDVTQYGYDAFGRTTSTQQYANPIAIPSTINASNIAAAVTTAGGATGERVATATYNSLGLLATTGDALGVSATYSYDARGLRTKYVNRDGATWIYSYDAAGRQVLEQSPATTVGSYNATNGAFQTASNQFLYTSTAYTAFGDVASISHGYGASATAITTLDTTSYAYDADGRRITTTAPGSIVTHTVYNAFGQSVATQDANGHWQYRVYNANGQLAYFVDTDQSVTAYGYDAYGNVLATTSYATPLQSITGWTSGHALSVAQIAPAVPASANDRVVTSSYDQLNRLTQVQKSAVAYVLSMGSSAGTGMAAAQPTTRYTYDVYGNQTSVATLVQGANGALPDIWDTSYSYYDAANRVAMTVTPTGAYNAPQGYVTTTAYNAFGDVAVSTQYAQAISTTGISTATRPGVPAAGTMASGGDRSTAYAYDGAGRLITQTTTGIVNYTGGTVGQLGGSAGYTYANSVTSYAYDGEGRLTATSVNGATTTTAYDALGRVASVTAPARQALVSNWSALLQQNPSWDLNNAGLYASVSPVTSYTYDALGRVLGTTTSSGAMTTQAFSSYNAQGWLARQTDAEGNVQQYTYDSNGNVLTSSYTLTTNGASSTVTTTHGYDLRNRVVMTNAQRSGQSGYDTYQQWTYTIFGEVLAEGDTSLHTSFSYDNAGHRLTALDPQTSAKHTYSYDLMGRQVLDSTTVTGGAATTQVQIWLDMGGRVVQQRTPSTNAASGVDGTAQVTHTYDRWGNVLSTTDADGNTTSYAYDGQNHLIQQTEANVLVVSDSGSRSWSTPVRAWYYNIDGELIGSTDENGNSSWNTYDMAGKRVSYQDNAGAKTYFAYDALGRSVAQETPPASSVTGLVSHIEFTSYNRLNQIVGRGDFLPNAAGSARTMVVQEAYVLNGNGDRIQVTDGLGNTSFYNYDSQHHVLASQTALQKANGKSQTFTYDVNGYLISQTDADGYSQSWVYDYFGRVKSHVDQSGASYTYTYDASSGRLTQETSNWSATGPSASTTSTQTFQYMADGQLSQVTQVAGSVTSTYTYQYDANGNQTVQTANTKDGAGQSVNTQTVSTYDSHNRLQEVTVENAAGTAATMRTVYNYDAAGNRRAVFAQDAYAHGGGAGVGLHLVT